MPYYYLSEEDKRLLDWVIADARNRLGDPVNGKGRYEPPSIPGAPEVYVATPSAAINPITYTEDIGVGTGTSNDEDTATSGTAHLMSVLQSDGTISPLGGRATPETSARQIFNISPNKITEEPILIIREKGGRWIPVPLSGVLQGTFTDNTDHSPCDVTVGSVIYSCVLQALPAAGYHYSQSGKCFIARTQNGWEVISIVDCTVEDTGSAS